MCFKARLGFVAVLSAITLVFTASAATATQVKIDFESGATLNQPITNQYGAPGTPAGPVFKKATDAGFNAGSQPALSGLNCGAPALTDSYTAYSGSKTADLSNCNGGEFSGHAAFFALGYTSGYVEFQVGVSGGTPSSCNNGICDEIWTTAFDKDRNVIGQQQTLLGPNTSYKTVPLVSAGQQIAFVAVELGSKSVPSDSATGVTLSQYSTGSHKLLIDDLVYEPPSSPPDSSFLIGASPNWARIAPGGSVQINIPISWVNNPNPAASPVSFELTSPAGINGSFSPNPSNTGTSKLTLSVEKWANAGDYSLTVDAYVDKGLPSEKHAATTIPFTIELPFTIDPPGAVKLAPCTPRQLDFRVATGAGVTDPLTLDAQFFGQPGLAFTSISNGNVLNPSHAVATVTPQNGIATATLTLAVAPGTAAAGTKTLQFTVSGSGYATRASFGTVEIEAGHVSSITQTGYNVNPTFAAAPMLGRPGTKLTLDGTGFCPNMKVAVGAANDPVDPERIAADGRSLDFRVSRGATTGPIHLLPAAGTAFDGPQLGVQTFRDLWGFKTDNSDWKRPLDGTMVDEMFGVDETNINVLGWLIRKPEAMFFEGVTNKHVPGGLCFGMAYLSDVLHEWPSMINSYPYKASTFPWSVYGPKTWDLRGDWDPNTSRMWPSEPLLRSTLEYFSLQFSDELIPLILDQAVFGGQGLAGIKSELAQGHPAVVGLMKWNGLSPSAHTVLAYDSYDLPNGKTVVRVYNPNVPYARTEEGNVNAHAAAEFTNSQIVFDNNESWSFPQLGWTGGNKNVIVFPKSRLPILNGKSPHMPNVFVAFGLWAFGSSGDEITQVTDDRGGELADGQVVADSQRWPKGVAPLPELNGDGAPLQMLAIDNAKASSGRLRATIRRARGGGAMNFALPRTQISLDANVKQGQIDIVDVARNRGEVTYRPGASKTAVKAALVARTAGKSARKAGDRVLSARAAAGGERVARVRTSAGHAGMTFSFAGGRTLALVNAGPTTTAAVELSAIGRGGRPIGVRLPKITLPAGSTLRVKPLNWRTLDTTKVKVTVSTGRVVSTRVVRGRPIGRAFASIVRVRSTSTQSLGLSVRAHRPPAGSWLTPVVEVLRRGRIVTRAKPARFDDDALNAPLALNLKRALSAGSYKVRIRMLEVTADGPLQSSRVIERVLPLKVAG